MSVIVVVSMENTGRVEDEVAERFLVSKRRPANIGLITVALVVDISPWPEFVAALDELNLIGSSVLRDDPAEHLLLFVSLVIACAVHDVRDAIRRLGCGIVIILDLPSKLTWINTAYAVFDQKSVRLILATSDGNGV